MMQLIAINDPAVIDINKKMSTLGEPLETNNLALNTVNCSNNVSKNENTSLSANVKNEIINGMNQASLNINGILKINGAKLDDKTENDQIVVENKIETNGQTNENSVPNVDCKISADDMNNSEKNLEDKKEVILAYDIKVPETKNIVSEVSSEIPALNETMKTVEITPTNVDISIGDNVTANKISVFSTNSDADEKEINISSQLQQLENDASIENDVSPSSITEEINKEIGQETASRDIISLNLIEENKADSLLKKKANDELFTNKTEQIVLSCTDSPIINAKNNGIIEFSTENESIVDEVLDDIPVISHDISYNVDHVIINKQSAEETSNLSLEELSEETNQKEIMDIDDEQIDPPSRDGLTPNTQTNIISEVTTENESIVDEVLDDIPVISHDISYNVDHVIIDKQSVEETSNLSLEELSEETNQKEIMDIDDEQIDPPSRDGLTPNTQTNRISEVTTENESILDEVLDDTPVISDNISHNVDHVNIDEPSLEQESYLLLEEISKETNQQGTMEIDDEQIDPPCRDGLKSNTQNIVISEVTSENEPIVDKNFDEAPIISDNLSAKVDQDTINKQNLEVTFNLPLGSFEESNQEQTIDAAKETNNKIKLDENDEMLKSQIMDVDDTVVCTSEKQPKAAEIISDNQDSIKNDNEDKNSAEIDVEQAGLSKKTTEVDSGIPSKDINLIQNDNVVMNFDDAKEMSSEESALPTDVDTNGINVGTKTDDALSVNLDAVEVEQKQKVNFNMDIDDVEEFSTVVSALDSDVGTKEINTETKSNLEVPTEQDPVVCLTDKNETNVKERNLMNSGVKDNESSEVISIDENENDASQDKPVISFCSVAPEETKEKPSLIIPEKNLPVVCKLSNTMDILSDDEDESSAKSIETKNEKVEKEPKKAAEENRCINLDDDDDIMFIEDTNSQEPKLEHNEAQLKPAVDNTNHETNLDIENENSTAKSEEEVPDIVEKGKPTTDKAASQPKEDETIPTETSEEPKPIISKTFLQSVTKNLADMTRNELEDFCILKLVESVVDKSNLNEIKSKMKTMTQTLDDLRKKTVALTKQNRDLQVVVKTIQEDQKKRNTNPLLPMKITRSVGMQVVLTGEKSLQKRKPIIPTQPPPPMTPARPARTSQSPKIQLKPQANIPVPRLVPASSPTLKPPATPVTNAKVTIRNVTPQRPEKRPHNKVTSPAASSVTVDLTDDEPPSKITTKNPTPPVRLVPSQNLMPKNRPQFTPNTSNNSARESPRKVYIPISSNNPRPAVGKNFAPTPRSRPPVIHPSVVRMQTVRVNQVTTSNRHPAPLPDAMKQYQPPGWKLLPPAPDLKLSKVDNGIVISWKFEGYPPDAYEEVASFQLYAYQETPSPPSTALWKKIGDIKALPLPMACTLTQFMSGFKYYFAVRAIDIRSRIGPFSLPGSIMLISKS